MKKDVIYIDAEDDLTTVIEKLKNSPARVVALVPPRRLGMLQSVVNLKLLKRAADDVGKKAVLITSDQSLISLTAGTGLPVARNLQSRPELIPEVRDETTEPDVIEGQVPPPSAAVADNEASPAAPSSSPSAPQPAKPKKPGKRFKIPNFESFRKRLLLIVGGLAVLIAAIIWAIIYAPKATIVIKAQTEKVAGEVEAKVDSELKSTNVSERSLKGELRQSTSNLTQAFSPTGQKNIGEKAKGTITIRNCDYSDGFTLQSGAQFTADSSQTYTSTQNVTVPKFSGSASSCTTDGGSAGKATVTVEATAIGESFNVGSQNYTLPGITGKVDAVGTAMSGGSQRTVTVVTAEDVAKAKAKALESDSGVIKSKLTSQFGEKVRPLEDTFKAEQGAVQVVPGIDQEASGQATLTIPMTYTVLGVKNDDLSVLLSALFEAEIEDKNQQKVYDNGYKKLKLEVSKVSSAKRVTLTLKTNGFLGPQIDTERLKQEIVGKRHGEIESIVRPTPGVQSVESHFSPFWVTKAPKVEKISINLEVANEE